MEKRDHVFDQAGWRSQTGQQVESATGLDPPTVPGCQPTGAACSACGVRGSPPETTVDAGRLQGGPLVAASCGTFVLPLAVALLAAVWFRGNEILQEVAVLGGLGAAMVATMLVARLVRKTGEENPSR